MADEEKEGKRRVKNGKKIKLEGVMKEERAWKRRVKDRKRLSEKK